MTKYRRHDLTLVVRDHPYMVTFINGIQTIIYTRFDGMDAGEFKVRNGFICSYEPADSILICELEQELDYQREKLVVR
jgi:hypothetical protein